MGSILLVETEAFAPELGVAGHSVLTANADDAPALLREGGIDVVVIDLNEQTDILALARSIEELPDAPPIVLVSSLPTAPKISARIGATVFLPKPCDAAEVVAVVARLVGQLRPVRVVDDEPTGRARII